jgi:hypothetical protein
MTQLNIKQGDIPETLDEVDAAITKMEKRAARKTTKVQPKNDRQSKLALVGPATLEKKPAAKTAQTKVAKEVKPKAAKKPATAQYLTNDLNARGKTLLSPELVVKVFADKESGMKNAEIATKYNISSGSVSTILSGPEWFRSRMTRYGGLGWTYPTRAEKSTEKKAE